MFLAEWVGEAGRVIATDVYPRRIPTRYTNMVVLEHDITEGVPPGGPFHLIHTRLVLSHLPGRREILTRLTDALTPGGWLLVEDWQSRPADQFVALAPTPEAAALLADYQRTVRVVLDGRGHDPAWPLETFAAMLGAGLVDVDTQVTASTWPGGSPGCRHAQATLTQLRPALRESGMTNDQLDRVAALLADPRVVLHGRLLHSTAGRRPHADKTTDPGGSRSITWHRC